jgi:hypothetical protein
MKQKQRDADSKSITETHDIIDYKKISYSIAI